MSKPMRQWSHREYVEDLALAKSNTLVEVPLGGVYKNQGKVGQADVVEVKPSYTSFRITIYEVKRRRADLLKSLREEKHREYESHCHRFYYACRKGIVETSEIPKGIGLCLRNENGWYTVVAAKNHLQRTIPRETLLSYLFQRVKYQNSMDRREQVAQQFRIRRELKNVGEEVKRAIKFQERWSGIITQVVQEVGDSYKVSRILRDVGDLDEVVFQSLKFYQTYYKILKPLEDQCSSPFAAKTLLRPEIVKLRKKVDGHSNTVER